MRCFPLQTIVALVFMSIVPHHSFAAPAVQLPQTGQTGCWDAAGTEMACTSSGQDGAIRAGVAWPGPQRFTDNGNGTITDHLTDLVWLRNADCFGIVGWQQALDNGRAMAAGTCGLADGSTAGQWRLPNRKELLSIMSFQQANGAVWLNGQGFVNGVHGWYWTSDSYAPTPAAKWVVHSVGAAWADNNPLITPPDFRALYVRDPGGPAVTVNPVALSFGTVTAGNRSAARVVTVTNPGGSPLVVSGIALNGIDRSDFSVDPGDGSAGTCGTISPTIAPGQSCGIAVSFAPVAEGARTASLSLTSNASNSPTTVALSGTGEIIRYRVTASVSGGNGTVSSANPVDVPTGSTATISLSPGSGYRPGDVSGTCPAGTLNGSSYMTGAVTGDCSVVFTFVPLKFAISTVTSGSGSVACTPGTLVDPLTPVSCTATASPGSHIGEVTVDGTARPTINPRTFAHSFGPVTADHSLSVSFAVDVFAVTPAVSGNGLLDPSIPLTRPIGSVIVFDVVPGSGYRMSSVAGCGGSFDGTSFTTAPLSENCTVTAIFEPVTLSEVLRAYRHVVGKVQLDERESRQYDVAPLGSDDKPAPDGIIDVADIVILLRRISGLVFW